MYIMILLTFQSTLPVGGSDASLLGDTISTVISIHAPHGGSDAGNPFFYKGLTNFNPRSPWGERHRPPYYALYYIIFQSTLPARGATIRTSARIVLLSVISIHAPHGGSDSRRAGIVLLTIISIHAPRGGSDKVGEKEMYGKNISIHAPRGGSDKFHFD